MTNMQMCLTIGIPSLLIALAWRNIAFRLERIEGELVAMDAFLYNLEKRGCDRRPTLLINSGSLLE